MSFKDYRTCYAQLREGSEGTAQLENLLIGAMSDARGNFCLNRLKLTGNAFADLVQFLRRINGLGDDASMEKIPLADFKNDEFDKDWPASPLAAPSSVTFR